MRCGSSDLMGLMAAIAPALQVNESLAILRSQIPEMVVQRMWTMIYTPPNQMEVERDLF